MMAASPFAGFTDILTVPHQPSSYFAFLKRPLGKQNRRERKIKSSCAEPAIIIHLSTEYIFTSSH